MNREEFEIHEQDFRFFRTSCGLLGFIVFFIGSFLAFIIYKELDHYSQLTFILGGVSLLITLAFFFCVVNESKKIILPNSSEGMEMTPLINQQQPNVRQSEPEQPEPNSGLHWGDQTRHDCKYVRSVMNLPPGASDETVESENDPDPDMAALQQMRNSGSSDGCQMIREPSYDSIDSRTYEPKPNPAYESIQSHPSRHDCKYVRSVMNFPPGASDETVESKNDPDPDMATLQQMRNSGSSNVYQVIREPSYDSIDSRTYESNLAHESIQKHPCELKPNLIYESIPNRTSEYKPNLLYELKPNIIYAPVSESSKTSQDLEGDIDSIGSESIDAELHSRKERTSIVDDGSGSFDVELNSRNARTSIVDDGSSEIPDSRPDISPLKGLFLLSSSDTTKSSSTSLEKENGTILEKETENGLPKKPSSTDSEVEPEKPHVRTSEDAKSDNFSKSE